MSPPSHFPPSTDNRDRMAALVVNQILPLSPSSIPTYRGPGAYSTLCIGTVTLFRPRGTHPSSNAVAGFLPGPLLADVWHIENDLHFVLPTFVMAPPEAWWVSWRVRERQFAIAKVSRSTIRLYWMGSSKPSVDSSNSRRHCRNCSRNPRPEPPIIGGKIRTKFPHNPNTGYLAISLSLL